MKGRKVDKVLSRVERIAEEVLRSDSESSDTTGQEKLSRKSQRVVDTIRKGKALVGFGGKSKTSNNPQDTDQRMKREKQETGVVATSGKGGDMMDGAGGGNQVGHASNYRFAQPLGPLNSHPVTLSDIKAAERARE